MAEIIAYGKRGLAVCFNQQILLMTSGADVDGHLLIAVQNILQPRLRLHRFAVAVDADEVIRLQFVNDFNV